MSERKFAMTTPAQPIDWEAKESPPNAAPETFEEMFDVIFREAHKLMCEKQADYGPGNIAAFGEFGILVRANDKMERLKTLLESGSAPANESIEDSWRDLLNYAAISLAVRRGWWTKAKCPPLAGL